MHWATLKEGSARDGCLPLTESGHYDEAMNGKFLRLILPSAALLFAVSGFAQQATSDASFIAAKPKKTKVESKSIEESSTVGITGVVVQAMNMKKPLQMVNPLAPKKYGDGRDSVTWDPDNPEIPKGIIIFGLQW